MITDTISPSVEETMYSGSLLVDSTLATCVCSSGRSSADVTATATTAVAAAGSGSPARGV